MDFDATMEGWFTDPYDRHEARWMSQGHPTKLVRDNGVESYDDPPDEQPSREPSRIETHSELPDGGGLRRADDAESGSGFDLQRAIDEAEEQSAW